MIGDYIWVAAGPPNSAIRSADRAKAHALRVRNQAEGPSSLPATDFSPLAPPRAAKSCKPNVDLWLEVADRVVGIKLRSK